MNFSDFRTFFIEMKSVISLKIIPFLLDGGIDNLLYMVFGEVCALIDYIIRAFLISYLL